MKKKYHFIGVGGIGMSGLARILISQNYDVSGSDMKGNPVTESLQNSGAKIAIGHSKSNIDPAMTIVYSSDIKPDNPEYQAAIFLKCPLLHRSDLLAELMHAKKALAVAGTHGKTTTTSLLIHLLNSAGMDPSFAVGGVMPQFQSNASHGNGDFFIAEADESDGTFLKYHPYGAIVTNIDLDHMNHFVTEKALVDSFRIFFHQVSSSENLFWCGDDARLVLVNPPGYSYGFGSNCALMLSHFSQKKWQISFDMTFLGKSYRNVVVNLSGKHNALNASAVFGLGLSLGIPEAQIRESLETFQGVLRRCEKKGDVNGILFVDDYAHHPTEIETTLKAIRQAVPSKRLVVVFQPHRYTRTRDCLGTFGGIFDCADEFFITDIYSAGEPAIQGLTYASILEEIDSSKVSSRYLPRTDLAAQLSNFLHANDIVVTLGAGDITKLSSEIIANIKQTG